MERERERPLVGGVGAGERPLVGVGAQPVECIRTDLGLDPGRPQVLERLVAAIEPDDVRLPAVAIALVRGGKPHATLEPLRVGGGDPLPGLEELFKASVARCFRETLDTFQRAAEGKRGEDALEAMGRAYVDELLVDRVRLRAQMQAYAACDDPELCAVVRDGYGDLVTYVERVTGLPSQAIADFFAKGMLLNVIASMGLDHSPELWAERLVDGCKE